jgi:hypothetical protein
MRYAAAGGSSEEAHGERLKTRSMRWCCASLFDHLIGELQERLAKREAEGLGRFKIDNEFKLDW